MSVSSAGHTLDTKHHPQPLETGREARSGFSQSLQKHPAPLKPISDLGPPELTVNLRFKPQFMAICSQEPQDTSTSQCSACSPSGEDTAGHWGTWLHQSLSPPPPACRLLWVFRTRGLPALGQFSFRGQLSRVSETWVPQFTHHCNSAQSPAFQAYVGSPCLYKNKLPEAKPCHPLPVATEPSSHVLHTAVTRRSCERPGASAARPSSRCLCGH